MPQPPRILLLQLKRIGDTILTAPAVAALRARHPGAEIVMVVPESVAELVACFTGVSRVLAYRALSLNVGLWASIALGEWDACYDFTGTDRSALMTALSRAKQRHGYAKFAHGLRAKAYTHLCDASVRDLHTVEFHLALVGGSGELRAKSEEDGKQGAWSTEQGAPIRLPRPDDELEQRQQGLPRIVVHIGTAREEKFWPVERWVEVITHLAENIGPRHTAVRADGQSFQTCAAIFLTGTNAGLERPHLDRLRAALKVEVMDLTGQLSLVSLASLIDQCDLAIGVDSMAMHLAAMFGRPQVVLFGPTNPFHWRPRHARAVVLAAGHEGPVTDFHPKAKGAPMELISTRMVVDAIHRALSA